MNSPAVSYKNHRFPPQIIARAVWLYFRFPLSLRMVEEMLLERGIEKRNLIGKPPRFTKGQGGIVENIVLIVAAQQGQKVQPRLRRRRAEGGELFAADLCRMEIAIGMAGTCIVDRDKGSRDQAGMQHDGIPCMKAIQPLCQKPDDLAFGRDHR